MKNVFSLVLILMSLLIADTTQLTYTNHWAANTGGTPETHVQNFVEDMVMYDNNTSTFPEESQFLLTGSAWDEGHCGYCGLKTSNGEQLGKTDFQIFIDVTYSDTATYRGNKCFIQNFWGRASFFKRNYVGNLGPVPTNGSAPYVTCSDGNIITQSQVMDPSALAFDSLGNLWVSDAGPSHNIKIFKKVLGTFGLLRTFGDSGGVYAKNKKGPKNYRSGATGDRRFWGIRGIAIDASGDFYVASSGIPQQSMGGTDIRKYSHVDSSFLWKQQGLSFVNSASSDPASGGTQIYQNNGRFKMDYTKSPGSSWSFEGVTVDPFKYPDDPRLVIPMQATWIRRINGKLFQFNSDMVGGYMAVFRFTDTSEIAIPQAYICAYEDRTNVWGYDSAPAFIRNETNKRVRWYWIDNNGDGKHQQSEFGLYENWNLYNKALDVDENGNIWFGGIGDVDNYFRNGGISVIRTNGINSNGVLTFDIGDIQRYNVPYSTNGGMCNKIKHIVPNDVLYMAEGPDEYFMTTIRVYDHFTSNIRRNQVCSVDLGTDFNGQYPNIHLDQGTDQMTLPMGFTADADYIYVGYLDLGRYSRVRGEITVYDAHTCSPVGWIGPTSVTGGFGSPVDMPNGAIQVTNSPGGWKTITIEEDGSGKIMVYRWHP